MAQNVDKQVPNETWTLLTDADVTEASWLNKGAHPVWIKGTTDTTAPTSTSGAVEYKPGMGESNATLTDVFKGVAAVRLWAYGNTDGWVWISHA